MTDADGEPMIRLMRGDCLEKMRAMQAGSFDAIVTDPPFGVRSDDWDDMDSRELSRFSMEWLSQARRVSGELVVFCNQDHVIYDICRSLYKRVRRLIWFKPPGSQYAGGRECGMWYAYEMVLHCHDREPWSVVAPKDAEVGRMIRAAREAAGMSRGGVEIALRGKKTGLCYRWEEGACLPTPEQADRLASALKMDGEFHRALREAYESRDETLGEAREQASLNAARSVDVLCHRTVTNGIHPCEKPVELIEEILTTVGKDYRTVLDPFMGSGSTGKACVKLGRAFTGIEQDETYFREAERGIANCMRPVSKLDPRPAREPLPGQLNLFRYEGD